MLLRKLIFALVSKKTAQAMETESRRWTFICKNCGKETSIWEIGGIRYKAVGNQKTYMKCPACGVRAWQQWFKRDQPLM